MRTLSHPRLPEGCRNRIQITEIRRIMLKIFLHILKFWVQIKITDCLSSPKFSRFSSLQRHNHFLVFFPVLSQTIIIMCSESLLSYTKNTTNRQSFRKYFLLVFSFTSGLQPSVLWCQEAKLHVLKLIQKTNPTRQSFRKYFLLVFSFTSGLQPSVLWWQEAKLHVLKLIQKTNQCTSVVWT